MAKKPVQIYLEEDTIKQLQNRRGNLSDNVRSAINDYLKGTTTIHDFHEAPKAPAPPSNTAITEDLKQEIANEVLKKAQESLKSDNHAVDLLGTFQKYEPYINIVAEFVKGMATNIQTKTPRSQAPQVNGVLLSQIPPGVEKIEAIRTGFYRGMPVISPLNEGYRPELPPAAAPPQPHFTRQEDPEEEILQAPAAEAPPKTDPIVEGIKMADINDKMNMALDFIKKMKNEEFRSQIEKKEDLFTKYKTFFGFIPKDVKDYLKKLDFTFVQTKLTLEDPEKAQIVEDLKAWDYLEEQFIKLKEAL